VKFFGISKGGHIKISTIYQQFINNLLTMPSMKWKLRLSYVCFSKPAFYRIYNRYFHQVCQHETGRGKAPGFLNLGVIGRSFETLRL
jgi:hypothetical protein